MLWIVVAFIAALAAALYTFFDNYIVDVFFKGRTPQAQKIFFGPAYLITAAILGIVCTIQPFEWLNIVGLIIAGAIASLSYIPYYIALGKDDATSITILEQLSPIFYLFFGWLLLGDSVSGSQFIGFGFILLSPLVIVLSARKRSKGTKIGILLLIVFKVIISAAANVMIVKFGSCDEIVTTLFYVMIGKGLCDVILTLCCKKWRVRFSNVAKKKRNKIKFYGVFLIDHIIWIISDFAYYIALTLAPAVAIGSAVTKSLQPILVFVLGIILTILWPKFGREKNDKKTIITHFAATALAVTGIVLTQVL